MDENDLGEVKWAANLWIGGGLDVVFVSNSIKKSNPNIKGDERKEKEK